MPGQLHKTRGIVFRLTRYGETSIIVNIFTELFGLQGYIVNGVRSHSARNKIALYQPLTLLDLVVYHRDNADILRIREVKCLHPYKTLTGDIRKSSIAIFLNEMLNKAVRDQSHTEEICEFLIASFIALDELEACENFHLVFLLKLSRYLGFGPQTTDEVMESWHLPENEKAALEQLLHAEYDTTIPIPYAVRAELLEAILRFYASHIGNLGEIKSAGVLKEILGS